MTTLISNTKSRVQDLVDTLSKDLTEKKLLSQERVRKLGELKVFSRQPEGCEPICTTEGIQTLCRLGLDDPDLNTSWEALRCLANILLLSPNTRQIFVNLGYSEKASERLGSGSVDDEFLLSRILFLLTYEPKVDLKKLIDKHGLATNITKVLSRHHKLSKKSKGTQMDEMVLTEISKLIFNVTHFVPDKLVSFESFISPLFGILYQREIQDPPIQPPINHLINALLNLNLPDKHAGVFPPSDSSCNAVRLMEILDGALQEKYLQFDCDNGFEGVGPPLLSLLRNVYKASPDETRQVMRKRLLPTVEERDKPLGRGSTLSARLLRLTTSALAPNSRNLASHLLFALSNSDAAEFIRNVGYGFASGFLMSNNIALPKSAIDENTTLHGEGPEDIPINPVTGQTLEAEARDQVPLSEMTDEEKEREAERLFVLFERLKKTGVMKVKNPVEAAFEEGRFEEIE